MEQTSIQQSASEKTTRRICAHPYGEACIHFGAPHECTRDKRKYGETCPTVEIRGLVEQEACAKALIQVRKAVAKAERAEAKADAQAEFKARTREVD